MKWYHPVAVLVTLAFVVPAAAVQPPQRSFPARSAERWVRQLENELEHLQEDLYYERGSYPRGLHEQVEETSRAVTHFHRVLRRTSDREHLMRDFEEMDRQVHRLVDRLNQSGDSWLRRQASRIRYPDEQLHYALQRRAPDGQSAPRELLARHAHVLESEARNLQELVERVRHRDDDLRDAVEDFVEEAEHFHEVVEQGADLDHLRGDFRDVDEAWRDVVEHVNRSSHGLYLRRAAQNVNRIQNQIHGLLTERQAPVVDVPESRRRVERRDRPAIQFEIPGIGRFRIPQ